MTTKTILITLAVGVGAYMVYKKYFDKEEDKSNFTSCRAGTCPYTRADGTIFCTSAVCPKSTKSTTAKAGV